MPPAQVPSSWQYAAPVQHDDVIVVPEFFCKEEDWDTYYALIKDPEGVLQLPLLGVKIITMPGDARKPSQRRTQGMLPDFKSGLFGTGCLPLR